MCLFGVAPSVCVPVWSRCLGLVAVATLVGTCVPLWVCLASKKCIVFFCSLSAGLCHSDFQEKPKTRQRTARNTEKREKTTTKKQQQQLHITRKKDPKTKTLDRVLPARVNLSLSAMALGPRVSPTSPCWYPMLTLMAYWTMCLNARMMSRRRCLTKPKLTILKRKQQCELSWGKEWQVRCVQVWLPTMKCVGLPSTILLLPRNVQWRRGLNNLACAASLTFLGILPCQGRADDQFCSWAW